MMKTEAAASVSISSGSDGPCEDDTTTALAAKATLVENSKGELTDNYLERLVRDNRRQDDNKFRTTRQG
jgi:molybdopterin-biosynthesis enzyme MoeA-like protein